MLKFISTGNSGYFCGYSPSKFNIELDKEYTVRELINEVLKSHSTEWGEFRIRAGTATISDQVIKYKHGVLLDESSNEFSDESYILDKKVVSVTSEGGYTNMNYIINLNLERSSELVNTDNNILMNLLRRSNKLSN